MSGHLLDPSTLDPFALDELKRRGPKYGIVLPEAAASVIISRIGEELQSFRVSSLGYNNRLYYLTARSGAQYVIKVCGRYWKRLKTETEVVGLFLAGSRASIPAPRILSYDSTGEEFGVEYTVMRKLEGVRLDDVWGSLSQENKLAVVGQLADLVVAYKSQRGDLAAILPQGKIGNFVITSGNLLLEAPQRTGKSNTFQSGSPGELAATLPQGQIGSFVITSGDSLQSRGPEITEMLNPFLKGSSQTPENLNALQSGVLLTPKNPNSIQLGGPQTTGSHLEFEVGATLEGLGPWSSYKAYLRTQLEEKIKSVRQDSKMESMRALLPRVERLLEALDSDERIVDSDHFVFTHGDLTMQNLLITFLEGLPTITAVLDWEWSGMFPAEEEFFASFDFILDGEAGEDSAQLKDHFLSILEEGGVDSPRTLAYYQHRKDLYDLRENLFPWYINDCDDVVEAAGRAFNDVELLLERLGF